MNFIYLAAPYSHVDLEVIGERYNKCLEATAELFSAGFCVYSPIVHCHPVAVKYKLPAPFSFWKAANFAMLRQSGGVIVLSLPGVHASVGVAAEVGLANKLHLPTRFVESDELLEIARVYFSHCRHTGGV